MRPTSGAVTHVAAALVGASLVGGGIAAAGTSGAKTVHVCANKGTGALRAASKCVKSERALTLATSLATGPAGPAGPSGPAGATGPAGVAVPRDATGHVVGLPTTDGHVVLGGYIWSVSRDGSFTATGAIYNQTPMFTSTNCSGTTLYGDDGPTVQVLDRDQTDATHAVRIDVAPTTRTIHSAVQAGSGCVSGLNLAVPTITAADVSFVPLPPSVPAPVTFG